MRTTARRERERENTRTLIVEAARDLVSEHGLDALSMRMIAERIEYSPATIYLYFRDKEELLREVVKEGFERMRESVARELTALGETANAADQYGAMGLAYARFALEHPAYFRVMFELPRVARLDTPCRVAGAGAGLESAVEMVRRAAEAGLIGTRDARRTALIGWGLIHGLTSLYLSGHLTGEVSSREDFLALVGEALRTIDEGWKPGSREA